MPVLENPRQELFAQGVASGLNCAEAYVQAGYKAKVTGSPANQVLNKPGVRQRINELFEKRAELDRKIRLRRI